MFLRNESVDKLRLKKSFFFLKGGQSSAVVFAALYTTEYSLFRLD